MKGIYKLDIDCGRLGHLLGTFIAESEHIPKIAGRAIYFGEVLGTNSDVSAVIHEENFTLVNDNPNVIDMVEKCDLESGCNPFDYWLCPKCEKRRFWLL